MTNNEMQSIRTTISLLKSECSKHKTCHKCALYIKNKGCIIACPPQFIDATLIITMLGTKEITNDKTRSK